MNTPPVVIRVFNSISVAGIPSKHLHYLSVPSGDPVGRSVSSLYQVFHQGFQPCSFLSPWIHFPRSCTSTGTLPCTCQLFYLRDFSFSGSHRNCHRHSMVDEAFMTGSKASMRKAGSLHGCFAFYHLMHGNAGYGQAVWTPTSALGTSLGPFNPHETRHSCSDCQVNAAAGPLETIDNRRAFESLGRSFPRSRDDSDD